MENINSASVNKNSYNDEASFGTDNALDTIRNFITSAVVAQKNLLTQEQLIEKRFARTEEMVNANLKDIEKAVLQVQERFENADVESLRITVEAMRAAGKERTQGLQDVYIEIKKSIKKACERVEQASTQILKGLGRTLDSLHPSEFQHLTDSSAEEVKKVSTQAVQKISNTVRWFHWKNLVVVFLISLVVSLSISLYLDDEWPWEIHSMVVKQRAAGEALMNSWATLTPSDQQLIAHNVA